MVLALVLTSLLAQGSTLMAGPAPRSRAAADYYDSFLVGASVPLAQQCTNAAYTTVGGQAITVSRASSIYCTKSDGSMVLVGANKLSVESRGISSWAARTNLILYSEALSNAAWTKLATVTSATHAAPWGGTLDTVTYAAGATAVFQSASFSSTTGPFVLSGYGRAVTGTHAAGLDIYCSVGGVSSCSCTRADGSACTTIVSGTDCIADSTFSTTPDRLEITTYCNAATSALAIVDATAVGVTSGAHVWGGVQFEVGARKASPYIPTTGTATLRAGDEIYTAPSTAISSVGCVSATLYATADTINKRLATTGSAPGLIAADVSTSMGFYYSGLYTDPTNALRTISSNIGRSVVARAFWKTSPSKLLNATVDGVSGADVSYASGMTWNPMWLASAPSAGGGVNGWVSNFKWDNTFTGCRN